jgi:hypothetical protein
MRRTVVEARQRYTERRQLATERTLDVTQRPFREQTAGHAGLIRDHDQCVSVFVKRGQSFHRSRSKPYLLWIDIVGYVRDQCAVLIKEDGPPPSV